MDTVEATKAHLEELGRQVEGRTQITPASELSRTTTSATEKPANSEFNELRTIHERELARAAVIDFFAEFPSIPLEKPEPIKRTDGSIMEVPTYPLHKNLEGVFETLLHFNGAQYAQDTVKQIADIVIEHKTGDIRLPDEVDGKWNDQQVGVFKRSLVFGDMVPEDYAKTGFSENVMSKMKKIVSGVSMFFPSRNDLRELLPSTQNEAPPTTPTQSSPTPPSSTS